MRDRWAPLGSAQMTAVVALWTSELGTFLVSAADGFAVANLCSGFGIFGTLDSEIAPANRFGNRRDVARERTVLCKRWRDFSHNSKCALDANSCF